MLLAELRITYDLAFDRITNNCYRVDLSGDVNMRELTSRVAR